MEVHRKTHWFSAYHVVSYFRLFSFFPKTFSFIFFAIMTGFDRHLQGPGGSAEARTFCIPMLDGFTLQDRIK